METQIVVFLPSYPFCYRSSNYLILFHKEHTATENEMNINVWRREQQQQQQQQNKMEKQKDMLQLIEQTVEVKTKLQNKYTREKRNKINKYEHKFSYKLYLCI